MTFVLKLLPAGLDSLASSRGLRPWGHFLWCGGGVNFDSHIKPWNVSGLLGSVGWPGCGEAATQRAHSHIPLGPPHKHAGCLPSGVLSGVLLGVDSWIPCSPGSTVIPGGTASGEARPVEQFMEGTVRLLQKSSSWEEAGHPGAESMGKTLEL